MIWYESDNPNSFVTGRRFSIDKPCVTIMANRMGGDSLGHWHIINRGEDLMPNKRNVQKRVRPNNDLFINKPTYKVPSMEEIHSIPWNGLTVASTFSGCGGSCLGYRMAGYRVVWANEFVPAAQESYNANKADSSFLDTRDIRTVKAEEILEQTGLAKGELDLFDGSPPCQAFSTAGKREKGWGTEKKYEHGVTQKNEQLFDEYIRLLDGIQPRVFVAENVSGLVKGAAKGMFLEFLAGMKACGYRVKAKVLDAQWLGVPQVRRRVIFVGVRNDIGLEPAYPTPLPYRYSVRDALPWIDRIEQDSKGIHDIQIQSSDRPVFAITASNAYHIEVESSLEGYAIGKEWEKLKPGEQSEKYFSLIRAHPDKPSGTICASHGSPGIASVTHHMEKRKFTIAELRRICAFPDDFVLIGSYAKQWERLGNSVPPMMMRAVAETIRDKILR